MVEVSGPSPCRATHPGELMAANFQGIVSVLSRRALGSCTGSRHRVSLWEGEGQVACSTWGTRDRERDWTKGFRHCLHSTRDNRPGQDRPWEVVKGLRWPIFRS